MMVAVIEEIFGKYSSSIYSSKCISELALVEFDL